MKLLDLTLPTPAENLALDEALLEEAEAASEPREVLRLWESPTFAVIVGRASRVADEVHLDACRERGIPVLRRCSGGCSVVIGPGCLMYSVVLDYENHPGLQMIEQAHRFVLTRIAAAVRLIVPDIQFDGTSDLTLGGESRKKFSGNSLRCKRTHLLYHGTLLYDIPLDMIATTLRKPPRQPDYRAGRRHEDFVANLPCRADNLLSALRITWQAVEPLVDWPSELTRQLVEERYSLDAWNYRL
jgi:lipoate---protein ligase